MSEQKPKKKFARKLLHKYRLVILNEDTFEERFSIKLTRLNVFVLVSLSSIFLVATTTFIIAFTSLREFIPGYSSAKLKRKATELNYKTDSLQQVISLNEQYYASIKRVLTGDVKTVEFNRDSAIDAANKDVNEKNLMPTRQDSLLREKVDKEDKYNLFETAISQSNFVLFPPVNGSISEGYDLKTKHFAV